MLVAVYGVRVGEEELFEDYSAKLGLQVRLIHDEPTLENLDEAEGSSAILIRTRKFPRAYVEKIAGMGIRYLCTRSVGTDHIDKAACEEFEVEFSGCGYSPSTVAEFAVMLILMGLRKVPSVMRQVDVQDYTLTKAKRGRELRDCTVGVIGTGHIGGKVVEILRGFGPEIVCHSHRPVLEGVEYVTLDDLLMRSDVITLHVPGQESPILGEHEFSLMKDGVVLVNTARGSLIDQPALIRAVESGKIGAAMLDVLQDEKILYHLDMRGKTVPNRDYHVLKSFPEVCLTPHMAFFTEEGIQELAMHSLEWVSERVFN